MEKTKQSEELRKVIRDILGSKESLPPVEMPEVVKEHGTMVRKHPADAEATKEREPEVVAPAGISAGVEQPVSAEQGGLPPVDSLSDLGFLDDDEPMVAAPEDVREPMPFPSDPAPKKPLVSVRRKPPVELPTGHDPAVVDPFPIVEIKKKKGGGMKVALLAAAVIIVVGLGAAALIIWPNAIPGLSLFGSDEASRPAGTVTVAAASMAGGGIRDAGGNAESGQALADERGINAGLREEIEGLNAELEAMRASRSSSEEETRLRNRATQLEQEKRSLEDKAAGLERDLAASSSELNVLRASADSSRGASEQLQELDKEYRNVLAGLQEAQAAGRKKDQRIEELQGELTTLRSRLASTTTQQQKAAEEPRQTRTAAAEPAATDSAVEIPPVPLTTVKPKYPEIAKRRRVEGIVKLRVLVSEAGKVLQGKVISSPDPMGSLDRAALDAVYGWKFQPGTRGGKPVQMYYEVQMLFEL